MTNGIEARQALERKVVEKLLEVARAAGWEIPAANDGEELVECSTDQEVLDTVFSVDVSYILFKKAVTSTVSVRGMVYIVLGNDGYDCIADHSTGETFVAEVMSVMDKFTDGLQE